MQFCENLKYHLAFKQEGLQRRGYKETGFLNEILEVVNTGMISNLFVTLKKCLSRRFLDYSCLSVVDKNPVKFYTIFMAFHLFFQSGPNII